MRNTLKSSGAAAVSIAVLLIWSLQSLGNCLWIILAPIGTFVFTAVAILGIPYVPDRLTLEVRVALVSLAGYCLSLLTSLLAAWTISQWVYKGSPIKALIEQWNLSESETDA